MPVQNKKSRDEIEFIFYPDGTFLISVDFPSEIISGLIEIAKDPEEVNNFISSNKSELLAGNSILCG